MTHTPDDHALDTLIDARWQEQALGRRRFLQRLGLAAGATAASAALAACGGESGTGAAPGGSGRAPGGGATPATGATAAASQPVATAVPTAASSSIQATTAPGGAATAAPTSAMTAAMPKKVPQLTIANYDEPDTMDPHRTPSRHMWILGWAIYDPLVISTDKGEIFPNLAKSWEIAPDGLTYTFKLRDDVKFHDGTKFNAAAVKYNYDRVVDPKTGSLLSVDDIGPYESSAVVDEYTVSVRLKRPYGPFLRMISLQEFGMISPTAADKAGLEKYGRTPVGTGPWKFVEWVPQDRMVLTANPDYQWAQSRVYAHNGAPYIEKLTYRFVTDAQARIAALESGEVDAVISVPQREVERLEKTDKYQILKFNALGHPTSFIFNVQKAPTNELPVRRALNIGLNRAQIAQTLYANQNTPAYGPLSPASFGYWKGSEDANKYDLAAAQKLLDDAGWKVGASNVREKDGKRLSLELYVFGANGPVAEATQNALRDLRVDVKITVGPFTDQKGIGFDGKHNLMLVTFGAPDPRILRLLYHSDNYRTGGWNWTHMKDANPDMQKQLDAMLDAGEIATDPAMRVAHYTDAQRLLVENGIVLPVKNDFQIIGLKKSVQGWKMDDQNFHPRPYDVNLGS